LDTDIVINSDINNIFQICQEDKLYACYENQFKIDDNEKNWGLRLFSKEEINTLVDKRAVNSGILLLKNCQKVRQVFDNILNDYRNIDNIDNNDIYDQEFINYHFNKENLIDKDKLNQFVKFIFVDYTENLYHKIPILHFYIDKLDKKISLMDSYINKRNNNYIQQSILNTKKDICDNLISIISECNEYLEGCFFSEHLSNKISDFRIENATSISEVLLNISHPNISNVLEIGFNAGFSTLLMLTVNPHIHITCVDICEHRYTIPCYNWILKKFPNRIRFVKGNSEEVLPRLIEEKVNYDMIHIDGGHSVKTFYHDVQNSIKLSKNNTVLVVDDYDFQYINLFWNVITEYHKMKKYKETKTQSIYIF
jgi:predicted O-methyltransferase YrrM